MARVEGVSLREIFETEDEDFMTFINGVVEHTVQVRAEQARQAEAGR